MGSRRERLRPVARGVGDEVLQAGDRVIVFTETKRVPEVERVL